MLFLQKINFSSTWFSHFSSNLHGTFQPRRTNPHFPTFLRPRFSLPVASNEQPPEVVRGRSFVPPTLRRPPSRCERLGGSVGFWHSWSRVGFRGLFGRLKNGTMITPMEDEWLVHLQIIHEKERNMI